MKKILSIDTGGTKTAFAIINEKGRLLSKVEQSATPDTAKNLELLFREIISGYENEVDYIAFATAGTVDIDNNAVVSAVHHMPCGYSLIQFPDLSSKPVFVENDANAAAWAEYKTGAATGDNNTITITIGTGIGGGFVADGRLIRGKSGRGGEIGSMKINGKGRICACGRKDCWESYASGSGLKTTAKEIAQNDEVFKCSLYKDKPPGDITTYDIIDGLNLDDNYSKKVFEIWIQDLITGLINITNIFDPDSIVLSGGMSKFVGSERIESAVNSEIVVSPVKIKPAKAGNYSGMIGAAILAAEKYG